jgi:hypothetical protein
MKYSLLLVALLGYVACSADESMVTKQVAPEGSNITVVCPTGSCIKSPAVQKVEVVNPIALVKTPKSKKDENTLDENSPIRIGVVGQGVAPVNTSSPAQAYALAKRAAVADAYRLIAEKVKGVRIEGDDLIKNMMVKRSTVRTTVKAMVRNANVVETTYKDGLCEVEMEIVLSYADFAH